MEISPQPESAINDFESRLQAALGETYRNLKELGGTVSRVFLAGETRLEVSGAQADRLLIPVP